MSKSIMHDKTEGTCYLCILLNDDHSRKTVLEEHHVMDGPNRRHSEHYGLKVYLCIPHHREGKEAVHNNITNMRLLQRKAQEAFEKKHGHEKWMGVFGINFL